MKRLLTISLALGLFLTAMAHPVDMETAKAVAIKLMGTNNLQLSTTYKTGKNENALYVFNTGNGFVIVAADDCETPIIAYSHESIFHPDNVPPAMEEYLQDFVTRIHYGIENHMVADKTTAGQWAMVKATGRLSDNKTAKVVEPLITAKWHQGCLYNNHCPAYATAPCGHAEVGCAAVAMGQIMHYWGYPSTGWGTHSYSNSGTSLSADFGNTTYAWEQMPNMLDEASSDTEVEAVSTLLFHCGVSIEMRYNANGAFASATDIPDALMRYFNYSRQLRLEKKKDFDDETWMSLLKQCLDKQQPVLYSGFGNAGHAFVCDGYDSDNLFHFNWGWGGNADGYFALGNLNPNGYDFNANNYAILDINPQYEPCLINATVFPSNAGIVEGAGEYHYGSQCTLTAIPSENYDFYYWMRNGQIFSNSPTITLDVEDDIPNIEAYFSCYPVNQIIASYAPDENDPSSPYVSLSWNRHDTEWVLLKQFEIQGETGGIVSDGEYFYITYAAWNDPPINFEKYTLDGTLVESFNLDSIPDAFCLAYDGTDFYCNGFHTGNLSVIYRIDMDNKTVLESTEMSTWFAVLSYDPEYDGFWISNDYHAMLFDRQGNRIITSPRTPDYLDGTVYLTDQNGDPHLLLLLDCGIYDYSITNNVIKNRPLLTLESNHTYGYGACSVTYDGKNAMAFSMDSTLCIYEIRSTLEDIPQIVNYRIYRSDSADHTVMVADEVDGSSYMDTTWNMVFNGMYRYGISSVFVDGSESEIVWSEPIAKTNYGIGEIDEPQRPTVQKIIEDNRLFILVNGKKYSITGQEIHFF